MGCLGQALQVCIMVGAFPVKPGFDKPRLKLLEKMSWVYILPPVLQTFVTLFLFPWTTKIFQMCLPLYPVDFSVLIKF